MYYKVVKDGLVYDGGVSLNVNLLHSVYEISYHLKIRIGKSIWGAFIGKTVSERGSIRIPKYVMSERHIKDVPCFNVQGVQFTKKSEGVFTFHKKLVKGTVYFGFDGNDPVEILKISMKTPIVDAVFIKY